MFILRGYQKKAILTGLRFFYSNSKKNSYEVLPTAAGKSIVIANIARELDEPVLILQPSKELLEQNFNKYISYGNNASIYSASLNKKEIDFVTFATIGSIYKKPELFKSFKYVIVDECHLVSPEKGGKDKEASMHIKFLSELKVKLLGLTASPFQMKYYQLPENYSIPTMLHRMKPKLFQELIHVTQIKEMVDNGYWSKLRYIVKEFDRSELIINSNGTNYIEDSIEKSLLKQGVIKTCIQLALDYKKNDNRKKTLIFAPTIEISELIANKLKVKSISSSTNNKDREKWIKDFKEGRLWALVNVSVLATGFDEQQIDLIIDCQPTLSLTRYYQKLGRGVRIDLSLNPIKKDCVVIDLVGNYEEFGAIEDLSFNQLDGKWEVMSGKRILSKQRSFKIEKIPGFDDELCEYGKYKDSCYKDIPLWYLKFAKDKLKETDENERLIEYAKLKLK